MRDGNGSFFGTAAALAMIVPFAAGCSDDTTGPGTDEGTARAVVTDNPDDGSASVGPSDASFSQGISGATFEGTFSGEAEIQISVDGQTWVNLGPAQSVNFAMQTNEQAVVHASAAVPAGAFTRARLVMRNAQATLVSGSVGATPITAQVQIMVNSGNEFTVDLPLSFEISADTETTVVFDLNSEAWIDETNVQTQSATDAEIREATTVRVQ